MTKIREIEISGKYKINQMVLNVLLKRHGFQNSDTSLRNRVKEVVRDYCSEDLIETLIALNDLKRE